MLSQPLPRVRFETWLRGLLSARAADFFRSKGVLAFDDSPERATIAQGVHAELALTPGRPWASATGDEDAHTSRLVFIGRNLNQSEIEADMANAVFTVPSA